MKQIKLFGIHRVPKVEEELYQITCGDTIVCERTFKTKEDAKKYIDSRPWDLIFGLILVININEANLRKLAEEQETNKDNK